MNSRKRRGRPTDPMASCRQRAEDRGTDRDPSQWGIADQALDLASNADVTTEIHAASRTVRVRRQDVFDLLYARGRLGAGALNGVRRLQNAIYHLHKTTSGVAAYAPRIDSTRDPHGLADANLSAGARIDAVMSRVGSVSARLLLALCETELVGGRAADWRAIVQRETGESAADAQGAIVRMACENLAGAYDILDRRGSRPDR